MELSSSICEKQILHDVCDVCVDVARNQSSFSVKRPLLDLEPINETEQSSYCVQLMKRLNIQRQQIHFCNITLVAKEGREFKAHRNVLSAASPFFSKLLQSEMKEREEGVIRLKEISKSVLSDVLEFIYMGRVEINGENAEDLIIAADYLLLESLKTISGRFVEKQMTIGNCISTFYFAEKYRCEELVLRSTKFIQDNFTSVAKSDEFLNLEAEEVEKWISSENILVAAEEDVFRIILNWVEQNKRERKDKRRLETDAIVVRGRKKTYCYLPEKDEWKRLADGLSEDRNHTTPLIKFRDHLYSFGRYAQKAERYDPGFNSWTTLKLSLPNETFSLAVVNGQIHVIYRIRSRRAHHSSTSAPVIKRYNEELCTWETLLSSQEFHYRDDSCVVALGNCLYVLGGGYSNEAGRFDTAESKWQEIASMPISKYSPCGVATQERIFVSAAGGQQCEVYQVSTNEWHTIPSLNFTRFFSCCMVCVNETVYVLGTAENNSSQPSEVVVKSYDPKLNKWIQKTSIPINKSSEEETYSFQCSTLKLSKGLLKKPTIIKID
ncbi:unnamed protein product [Porites evermanni]|uniref:BTB domain-containing protein n=1 Tax=Porites evermanni TaxID=104178 RepID=A0ABN8QTV8_9CNID|nr:unnamed protein product [Porites evermanni]